MPSTDKKIYCSLDIETSGFDPLKNEVLEIGFVFFQPTKNGFKILSEYSKVFKPTGEVPPNILGLTGISRQELDDAEPFVEHREKLQELLKDAVIVGHNIVFDIKFLEGFGLKFSGETIDTLDLVQWLLPTHHSYNLENLMHTFGIAHKEAHRALADSKATLKLLEKLLQIYQGLPAKLKTQINDLIAPYKFTWSELLLLEVAPLEFPDLPKESGEKFAKSKIFNFQKRTIYNFPIDVDYPVWLAGALSNKPGKWLLVVPKPRKVLDLYREKLITKPVFSPEQSFEGNKFEKFLKRKNLSVEEIKFALKVLVWQKTNWQTETILDLNLSFFGGQFKELINGSKFKVYEPAGLIACDQQVFLQTADLGYYKKFQTIVCGLNEFESTITSDIGSKVSWGYINYLLRSYYNPDLGSGNLEFQQPINQALAAGDLFFGLVNALLQTDPPGFQYYKISEQTNYDEKYQKIKNAAEHYSGKLTDFNKVLKSELIDRFILDLQAFFLEQENRVKWIELSENRCAFLSMPLDIRELVKKITKQFANLSFADSLDQKILPDFFMRRLGILDYKFKLTGAGGIKRSLKNNKQGDLFSTVKNIFKGNPAKINFYCLAKTATSSELLDLTSGANALPGVVLFGSQLQIKEFYEKNYQQLRANVSLLAQHSSGGSNKIFRNFAIHKNSLLLATDKFVLRHLNNSNPVEPVDKLPVKTLVLCHLPFEQFTHPYQEALGKKLENAFMDYALPKALFNFHLIIKFFYSPMLENIYIVDQKLDKPYAKVFQDYQQILPGAVLKSK